jgi:hypothetical protein
MHPPFPKIPAQSDEHHGKNNMTAKTLFKNRTVGLALQNVFIQLSTTASPEATKLRPYNEKIIGCQVFLNVQAGKGPLQTKCNQSP